MKVSKKYKTILICIFMEKCKSTIAVCRIKTRKDSGHPLTLELVVVDFVVECNSKFFRENLRICTMKY